MADRVQELIDASAENRVDDVEKLIALGVDVNGRGEDNRSTALGHALCNGNPYLVHLLLDAGASTDIPHGRYQMLPAFLASRRPDLMAMLLEAGADPHGEFGDEDDDKMSLLMYVTSDGDLPNVALLLSCGCDVNEHISGFSGGNILHYARCRPEDLELWQLLLEAGADPNDRNRRENTPLHRVARGASPEIVELLLSAGASIIAVNSKGATVLIRAIQYADLFESEPKNCPQWIEVVVILLEAGVDITHRDEFGWNALQHAAIHLRRGKGGEALQQIAALIQAEFERRKAAVLSVLPEKMRMLHGVVHQVLEWAQLVEGTSEEQVGTMVQAYEKLDLEEQGFY